MAVTGRKADGERLDIALREAKAVSRAAAQVLVKDLTPIAWHVARARGPSLQGTDGVARPVPAHRPVEESPGL